MIAPPRISIEGVPLDSVVELIRGLHEKYAVATYKRWGETFSVNVMGLPLTYFYTPGPSITRYHVNGRHWFVWVDLGGARFTTTDHSQNIVQWIDGKYARMFDFSFRGEHVDFQSDIVVLKTAGFIQ